MTTENNEEVTMKDIINEETMVHINSGDVVSGTVLSVNENEVLVNIGYMTDGVIPKEEVSNEKEVVLSDIVKIGDEISVLIMKINNGEGNVLLSKKRADGLKIWDEFQEILDGDKTLEVTVSDIVKGGATAYIEGVRAFIPASQISDAYVENLEDFKGKTLVVKIIELDKENKNIVLSRRVIEKAENEVKRDSLWNQLKKGEKRKGVVTRLAKFGAFVDLGGIDGLIHVSQLSWKRVQEPSEVVSVGDEVEVDVLDFDKEKGRISLGLKGAEGNPWNSITSNYKVGSVVEGTVVKLMDFGAFVQLESGIEGLVHLSEISEERIAKVSDVLKVGEVVKVKIGEINEKDRRISLSIKEAARGNEDFSDYKQEEQGGITLADLLGDKLKNFKFE
ncbi:30S ribosomal protein S1 [Clostridium lacusfryxellense]|uniref:30S ribosomal protein S1 n=1 Tax=Clostridium lacusfryxellense TaxID=205328 RepID=UPI001C0B69E8|nr:30S ribosomal protein S1 [Clostridium lacusfryxellense]MBU3110894.1 30S ribosomal protein S1 [Clostridium lacusfryxellense]